MALSTKLFSFFFLVALLSLQQIQARESRFFNKVTAQDNYVKDPDQFPTKEEAVKYNQEPTFVPQTQTGYGLYGHETTEVSPSTPTNTGVHYATNPTTTTPTSFEPTTTTPTTFEPYKTQLEEEEEPFKQYENQNKYYKKDYPGTQAYNNKNNYYNNNNYNGGNKYNVERQGMSDTRFMEKGKYFYDVNSEKKYDQNVNQYGETRDVDQNYGYNRPLHYGNTYDNSFEGYHNQQFQESNDVYDPWDVVVHWFF